MSGNEDDGRESGFESLMRLAVASALAETEFPAALAGFRVKAFAAPDLLADYPPDDDIRRSVLFALFREIWRVTPRPDNAWRPLPVPKIERNGPCFCGSGRKFKQCCGQAMPPGDFMKDLSVLGLVLEGIPAGEYAALPFKQLDPEEVAHTADQWLSADRYDLAIPLLEALLADPARLDERHEWAVDLLGDAYLDAGLPDKRAALVETMLQAPNPGLRVAAMHRRCTMLADAGDYEAAWSLFREAQRADPDNPSLAHLELVMLASRNEVDQLAARARFWAARLRKLGYEGEGIVELVDDIVRSPEGFIEAMKAHGQGADAALDVLLAAAENLPPPASHYRLQAMDDSAGPLEPKAELAKIEREWRHMTGQEAGDWHAWSDGGWIAWLAEHPLAWQSFVVLEDAIMAVDSFEFDGEEEGGMLDAIEAALLDHAVELLRRVIADNRAEGLKLEWGWMENRPALRLLGRRIDLAESTDEHIELLEWSLALNPNDNQGFRESLIHAYCSAKRPADALALCDRYPDDSLAGTIYGRVLALVLLGRRAEATVALAAAKKALPKVLKTLTAARPKRPASAQPGYITHGGDDQAWMYRQQWWPVWEATGALEWLKRSAGSKS